MDPALARGQDGSCRVALLEARRSGRIRTVSPSLSYEGLFPLSNAMTVDSNDVMEIISVGVLRVRLGVNEVRNIHPRRGGTERGSSSKVLRVNLPHNGQLPRKPLRRLFTFPLRQIRWVHGQHYRYRIIYSPTLEQIRTSLLDKVFAITFGSNGRPEFLLSFNVSHPM